MSVITKSGNLLSKTLTTPETYGILTTANRVYNTSGYEDLSTIISIVGSGEALILVDSDVAVPEDATIPATAEVAVTGAGCFVIAENKELTVNGSVTCSSNQCFDTSATGSSVVLGAVGVVNSSWFTTLQMAIDACCSGSTLVVNSNYTVTDELTISTSGLTITGTGTITQSTASKAGIIISESDVTIDGLTITGKQHATYATYEDAIRIVGASAAAAVENITVKNCTISNWGAYGVTAQYATNVDVLDCVVDGIGYGGIMYSSVIGGNVLRNRVNDVVGNGSNAYGIIMTRAEEDSLVTDPRTDDILIQGNYVSNIPVWEGIDTHGGSNLRIVNNNILACKFGISVGACDNGSSVSTFPPINILVDGNTIESNVSDGSYGEGVRVSGATGVGLATCIVSNNTILNHGSQASYYNGAITLRDTSYAVVSGNAIYRPSPNAITLNANNFGVDITGNAITDPWSTDVANPSGFYITDNENYGMIHGNTMQHLNKTATYVFVSSITVADKTGGVKYFNNYSEYTGTYDIVDSGYRLTGCVNTGSKTYDWGSVSNGAQASTTVAVPNAKVGDLCTASMSVAVPAGCILGAQITSSGTATVTLYNISGSSVDLASGTLTVTAARGV